MRDAAFILALQEPKIANLIFMDIKIILNLLGRTVTIPFIKVVLSEPPSAFCTFLSKGPVCTEGHAGRAAVLPVFTWMSLKVYRNPKSRSQDEVLLSLPHMPAQHCMHCTALLK